MRFSFTRAILAATIGLVFVIGAALPAHASVRAAKAVDACGLLTTEEISAVATAAPLGRGPTPRNAGLLPKNSTMCAWADEVSSGTNASAYTSLDRKISKSQRQSFGSGAVSGSTPTNSVLKGADLKGIGSQATLEILPSGSAAVRAIKGDSQFSVRVGYSGATPLPQVSKEAILSLARTASRRV